jgi:hypothetical protein
MADYAFLGTLNAKKANGLSEFGAASTEPSWKKPAGGGKSFGRSTGEGAAVFLGTTFLGTTQLQDCVARDRVDRLAGETT